MPLILTPRQLLQRSQFYQQLAQLTSAGIPLIKSLETLKQSPPSAAFREPIQLAIKVLLDGSSVADAWQQMSSLFPVFDIALVRAAEHSGRLDVIFKMLAQNYQERAMLLRQMISGFLYPVFLFHFAIFLFTFVDWFKGGSSFVWLILKPLAVLVPIYAVIGLVIYAVQGSRGLQWRVIMEKILRRVPILGSARHSLALSRLAAALEALLSAGVTVIEAWEMAAAACGSYGIQGVVREWTPAVQAGKLPSEAISAVPRQFPELFANLYLTGEVSGQLQDSLIRLHEYYKEESLLRFRLLAQWIPRLVYLMVAGFVAWKIVAWGMDYSAQIRQATDF